MDVAAGFEIWDGTHCPVPKRGTKPQQDRTFTLLAEGPAVSVHHLEALRECGQLSVTGRTVAVELVRVWVY